MKTSSRTFLLSLFACIFGTHTAPAADEPQALYVHCFLPTSEKPPTRADTVRVQLGKKVEAKPPQTTGTVTALVQKRGEKWHVELSGNYGPYTGYYQGEATLEKPVKALSYFFSGGGQHSLLSPLHQP